MTMKLPSREIAGLRARKSIEPREKDEMFALLSEHFEGVEREQFERDLAEKNWMVEVRNEGKLMGFSTLLVRETQFEDRALTVIYSGDTIVSPQAWNSSALAKTWIAAVNRLRGDDPARACYWMLLTSGFRTYRFLPVFWREFDPCRLRGTPPDRQRLLDYLAWERYGSDYDEMKGIVRFPHPQKLCPSLAALPAGRANNPDVAFFLQRNPGHASGDELACLTEISAANLTPAGRRMVAGPVE